MFYLVLYLPVIHQGYLDLFKKHQNQLDEVWVLSDEAIEFVDQELDYLRKDIRRLHPEEAVRAVANLGFKFKVKVANINNLKFKIKNLKLVMPDDDVSQVLIKHFFKNLPTSQIKLEPVFLRWDKRNTFDQKPVKRNQTISSSQFDQKVMKKAFETAGYSTDWWRHVGAVLIKDKQVVLSAYNKHTPGGYTPYLDGDPRSVSKSGSSICINTSRHAESAVIAEAAGRGIKTTGCDLYVTTFPCPYCARVIAHADIKTIYFAEGYTVLDGQEELKRAGVKIVKVNVPKEVEKLKDKRSKLKNYQS